MHNKFYVFELVTPGSNLDYPDKVWCHSIERIISHLEDSFIEANIALNLFENSRTITPENISIEESEQRWDRESARSREIQNTVELEIEPTRENYELIAYETRCRFEREKWQNGIKPSVFEHYETFIHARTFLYALDKFDKFLTVLSREPGIPEAITQISEKFAELFPTLRLLRNTAQHLEDRARGLGAGRNPKPMDLKPISTGMMNWSLGGTLALDNLEGSLYGSTTADGHYVQIDISADSLVKVMDLFHEIVYCFTWSGAKRNSMCR